MRYDINDHPRRRRTDQYEDECPMTPEQIKIMLDRQEQLINDVAEIKKYLFAGRIVVGMTSSNAAPTDVQPSSLLSMCGMGWDAADTNIQIMTNDGTGTATKTGLGASFPVPTVDRSKVYELQLYCAPNASTMSYKVTDVGTGSVASGTLSTDLIPNTTFISPRGWMSVGGTSSVIGIALMNMYVETMN